MATSAQVLAVCNGVLYQLEREPLGSTANLASPATMEERVFANRFDIIARSVLASQNWSCIRIREELGTAEVAESSLFSDAWSYAASLPGKRIAVWGLRLGGSWGPHGPADYLIESGTIYTIEEEVVINYGWYPRLVDYATQALLDTAMGIYVDSWPPALRRYIELQMAYELEPIFVKSATKREELRLAIDGTPRGTLGAKQQAISANVREMGREGVYDGSVLTYTGLNRINPLE